MKRLTTNLALVLASLAQVAPASAQSLSEATLANLEYRELGPTRQSGRFVDIAVPSDDPHTFYIATASGHLWKTTNRGITFDVLFDDMPDVFSIGAIAVAPSNSDVLYLGSGEANNSRS
ncbi:MAG: WD40/YVTN/BNR-like repeat-containing protein, partial [Longimicrobiales bacterium]